MQEHEAVARPRPQDPRGWPYSQIVECINSADWCIGSPKPYRGYVALALQTNQRIADRHRCYDPSLGIFEDFYPPPECNSTVP
jgi:hypothetical protein